MKDNNDLPQVDLVPLHCRKCFVFKQMERAKMVL